MKTFPETQEEQLDRTGWRPTEMVLAELLIAAFNSVRKMAKDPTDDTVEELFSFYDVKSVDAIKKYIQENKFEVRPNFPQTTYALPLVAVHAREESEAPETFLGDHGGVYQDENDLTSRTNVVQPINQTVDLIVITPDPQVTMMIYRLVWYIVFSNKMNLIDYANMHNLVMSGGALNFDQEVFPNWQYSRVITLKFLTTFDFYLPEYKPPKYIALDRLLVEKPEINSP